MATASGTSVFLARGVVKHSWTLTSSATVGRPMTGAAYPDKTCSARGTFGGSTTTLVGSNQLASTAQGSLVTTALNDSRGEGNPVSFTAANTVAVLENPNLIYPKISTLGTGAGKSVVIEIIAQSTRR